MARRRHVTRSIFDGKKRVNTFFVRPHKRKTQPTFLGKLERALKNKRYITKRTAHYLSVTRNGMMTAHDYKIVEKMSRKYGATSVRIPRVLIGKRSRYSGGMTR